jgi:hypothetical protein
MGMDLPAPLTPPDCDLRNFPYMPLDVVRLRDSDMAAIEDAEAFRSAILLCAAAWHQVPAASLPADEVKQARLAGYGRDVKTFRRTLLAGAMRGWILCDDGRFYHRVVAEKALEAYAAKRKQRSRTAAATAARLANGAAPPGRDGHQVTEVKQGMDNVTYVVTASAINDVTSCGRSDVTSTKGEEKKGEEEEDICASGDAMRANQLKRRSIASWSDDADFVKFYQAYPRKLAPKAAYSKWRAALKSGTTPAVIMAGLGRFLWPDDVQFIPHPATWLHHARWQDDPSTPAPAQKQVSAALMITESGRVLTSDELFEVST